MSFFSSIGDIFSGVTQALSPVSSLLGAGVSAASSLFGGQATNSAAQASVDKQEAFQDHESSTAYQRGTQDMIAAGLNPMLAYSQGGASSPAGGSIMPVNSGQNAVNSAMQSLTTSAQVANVNADTLSKLAMLPEKQVGGDLWGTFEKLLHPVTSSLSNSASSAGNILANDLPSITPSSAPAADDWLSQLEQAHKSSSPRSSVLHSGGNDDSYNALDALKDSWSGISGMFTRAVPGYH